MKQLLMLFCNMLFLSLHQDLARILWLTQKMLSFPIVLGKPTSIPCRCSQSRLNSNKKFYLGWFHQKEGQSLRSLNYRVSDLVAGVPDRFNDSGSERDFTLKISKVEPEDLGVLLFLAYTYSLHNDSDLNTNLPACWDPAAFRFLSSEADSLSEDDEDLGRTQVK